MSMNRTWAISRVEVGTPVAGGGGWVGGGTRVAGGTTVGGVIVSSVGCGWGAAATAPPGSFAAALGVDNRDRDPLGIDIFDARLDVTWGVRPRLELYGHLTWSRVVALPEVPVLPPPPLDLILPEGMPAPARPYYALYVETPYVNHRGDARFGEFAPGDALLAAKLRASEASGVACRSIAFSSVLSGRYAA